MHISRAGWLIVKGFRQNQQVKVLDQGNSYCLRSLQSEYIIIIYYATRAAHTHTTAYNHVHQHTQNCILRSIKHRKRLKRRKVNFMLKQTQ